MEGYYSHHGSYRSAPPHVAHGPPHIDEPYPRPARGGDGRESDQSYAPDGYDRPKTDSTNASHAPSGLATEESPEVDTQLTLENLLPLYGCP